MDNCLRDFLNLARLEADIAAGIRPEAEVAMMPVLVGEGLVRFRGFTTDDGWVDYFGSEGYCTDLHDNLEQWMNEHGIDGSTPEPRPAGSLPPEPEPTILSNGIQLQRPEPEELRTLGTRIRNWLART